MVTALRPMAPSPAITGVAVRAVVERPQPATSALRRIATFCQEAVLLLLAVLLIPIGILVVGAPITLAVRALLELAQRF